MKSMRAWLSILIAFGILLSIVPLASDGVPAAWAQGPDPTSERASFLAQTNLSSPNSLGPELYAGHVIPGAITPDLLATELSHFSSSAHPSSPDSPRSPIRPLTDPLWESLQYLERITDIAGATYDPWTGELIIIGTEDPSRPPLSPDSLIVGMRALLEGTSTAYPCVSIDFGTDPAVAPVRYCGGIQNTRFGFTFFESDRLLKVYGLGKDNITGEPVNSQVTDYSSECELLDSVTHIPEVSWRKWFSPTLHIKTTADNSAIAFSNTQMVLQWAYDSDPGRSYPAFEAAENQFVNHFQAHYFDFAEEQFQRGNPVLYELPQLAKLIGIGEWARNYADTWQIHGVDYPWLNIQSIPPHDTPETTPVTSCAAGFYNLQGGVIFFPGPEWYISDDGTAAGLTSTAMDTRPGNAPMWTCCFRDTHPTVTGSQTSTSCGGGEIEYTAVAIPLSLDTVENGGFETSTLPPWEFDGLSNPLTDQVTAASGDWLAFLGGYNNADDHLWQTVTIPPNATRARLTYYRAVFTEETTHPHDWLTVSLRDPSTDETFQLEALSDADASQFWGQSSFDVSNYAGRTLEIRSDVSADATNRTSFLIDDVRLDTNGRRDHELDITMRASLPFVEEGELITYTIDYQVTGNHQPAPGAIITSTIPQHTRFVNASDGGTLDGDVVRWELGDVVPQAEAQVSYTVRVLDDIPVNVIDSHTFIQDEDGKQASADIQTPALIEQVYLPLILNNAKPDMPGPTPTTPPVATPTATRTVTPVPSITSTPAPTLAPTPTVPP